jgi:hypothetical protein
MPSGQPAEKYVFINYETESGTAKPSLRQLPISKATGLKLSKVA